MRRQFLGKHLLRTVAGAMLLLQLAPAARAATIGYSTPSGSNIGGEAVDASATFTTSAGAIDIVLTNAQADPTSVKQVITGLFFDLDGGQTTGTLDSISGQERTISSGGAFADGGATTTGWTLTSTSSGLLLDILNFPGQPKYGIIGPPNSGTANYDNANGSIAGNNPHNPFINQVGTFSISIPGVTGATKIVSATFQFNTAAGSNSPGAVPEPSTAALGLLASVGLLRRRRAVQREGDSARSFLPLC